MLKLVKIFVEGIADKKFLEDYFHHVFSDFELPPDINVIDTGGWTNISSQKEKGENIRNQMKRNTANDGVNLVIFDADKDFATRKNEIEQWKTNEKLNFELFLFPNDNDSGDLEDLLEKIILDKNQPIFNCWESYETCLQEFASEKIGKKLTTPAKKTKIYGYLEALLGDSKSEKEKIKEKNRNYKNIAHWNLNTDYLKPLKEFSEKHSLSIDPQVDQVGANRVQNVFSTCIKISIIAFLVL